MQDLQRTDLASPQPIHEKCPSCGVEVLAEQKECYSCGIVFTNYSKFVFEKELKQKISGIDHLDAVTLKDIDKTWKKVVVNYHDKEAHGNFIKLCTQARAIPFAVYSYSRMLEIDSRDDIADEMRRQALNMLAVSLQTEEKDEPIDQPVIPLLKWITWFTMLTGVVLILLGSSAPILGNLVGLGVSFLFFGIVATFYRRAYLS